jgi:hypothetical protein
MTEVKEVEKKYLMDLEIGRYDLVKLAWEWVNVFQRTDDAKGMSPSEIVKTALEAVSSGAITAEDIKRIKSKTKMTAPVQEEKEDDDIKNLETVKAKKNEKTKKK